MPPNETMSKYWVFTLNNFDETDEQRLQSLHTNGMATYIVFGREIGESGTRHLQGYIEFLKRIRFSRARSLLGERCHIEPRKGNALQASEYCEKDGNFVKLGTCSNKGQGTRSDLIALHDALKRNLPLTEISDEHFGQFIKYQRGINAYRSIHSIQRDWICSVVVYWGKTGTGKTRAVYENLPSKKDLYVHPGGPWFDGYDGQPIVLFDDFGGSEFKLQYLLKLLDRYPMRVPIKGGFVSWAPYEIYITSNINPDNWYSNANEEHVRALKRRITNYVYFDSLT